MVQQYGLWIYGILFVIIFSETGFVVTPFLPGDSLLFVAGALAAIGEGGMDVFVLMGVLAAAAILGNMLNYQIGRYLGPKVFHWENSRFFNRNALIKTHEYYEKHGGKTLVISRFLPLVPYLCPLRRRYRQPCPTPNSRLFNLVGAHQLGGLALPGRLLAGQYPLGQAEPVIDHRRHHYFLADSHRDRLPENAKKPDALAGHSASSGCLPLTACVTKMDKDGRTDIRGRR
jgi:membrane protein YqaA with SNARE-associated domain